MAGVILRAGESGIHPLVAPAESLASSVRILEIASLHPEVLPCVGIHPHKAAAFDAGQIPDFEQMSARPEVVAVGEIGLDYFYEFSPRDTQIRTLSFFLDLAVRRNLPACIHIRDKAGVEPARAMEDLLSLVRPLAGRIRGVVHCFSGTDGEASSLLDAGLHLSFTGILTFKKAAPLRAVFSRLPPDRILLETDAPYLTPEPVRGRRNEPAFLKHIFALSASLLHLDEPEWSDRLRRTQQHLFGIRCG